MDPLRRPAETRNDRDRHRRDCNPAAWTSRSKELRGQWSRRGRWVVTVCVFVRGAVTWQGCWQRAKVFSPKLCALLLLRDRCVSEENTEWNGNDYNTGTGHLTPINLASRDRLETYTFLERQRSRSCVSLLDLVSDMSHGAE